MMTRKVQCVSSDYLITGEVLNFSRSGMETESAIDLTKAKMVTENNSMRFDVTAGPAVNDDSDGQEMSKGDDGLVLNKSTKAEEQSFLGKYSIESILSCTKRASTFHELPDLNSHGIELPKQNETPIVVMGEIPIPALEQEKEIVCSLCKLPSKDTDTLRTHIENVHMNAGTVEVVEMVVTSDAVTPNPINLVRAIGECDVMGIGGLNQADHPVDFSVGAVEDEGVSMSDGPVVDCPDDDEEPVASAGHPVDVSVDTVEDVGVSISDGPVVDRPADVLRATGDVDEPAANVENRIVEEVEAGKKKVVYLVPKRQRCVIDKGACVSQRRVDKLEAQLKQNIQDSESYRSLEAQFTRINKKSEQYYKLLQAKDRENEQVSDKLFRVFKIIESYGDNFLVAFVKQIFPDDFAKARGNAEQDRMTVFDTVAGRNGNRFANGVKRKASEVGVLNDGSDAKKMRETVQDSYYDDEETDNSDEETDSEEIEIVGESMGTVNRSAEERSSPNINVSGERLLIEEEGFAESDVRDRVARYSQQLKDGQFRCKDCRRKIGSLSLMLQHVTLHLTVGPYPCDVCRKDMSSLVALRNHRSRTCTGPATCHLCGKEFRNKGVLNAHKCRGRK